MVARKDRSELEAWAKRIGELVREGYAPPGKHVAGGEVNAVTVLTRELGYNRSSVQKHIKTMRRLGLSAFWGEAAQPQSAQPQPAEEKEADAPEVSRAEIHDSGFWRGKFKKLQKSLGEAEHLVEQLSGLRDIPYSVPDWLIDTRQTRRGKSVIGCLLSDIHMGEVITAEEILGVNAFDPDICRARLRRYFNAACVIGQRWAADTDCEGVLLALAGDMISGDIHEELRMTNALTSHEQVQAVVEETAAGIKHLKETYGRVHIVGVPGNHGRTTIRSTAKLYARLSYDTMCIAMLEREFRDDEAVTFQVSAAKDQATPIFGRTVFTTHGDKIGTRGGMGFAGPMLPIVRGSKKIEAQQAGIGRRPDLLQFGHYHTTGNPGMVLANGSVPGYSEYGDDLRAVVEPPQQWLYLLHSRWWLRERLPVQLEEPKTPEKPRIAVPASMTRA